jgi:hypothetical protein
MAIVLWLSVLVQLFGALDDALGGDWTIGGGGPDEHATFPHRYHHSPMRAHDGCHHHETSDMIKIEPPRASRPLVVAVVSMPTLQHPLIALLNATINQLCILSVQQHTARLDNSTQYCAIILVSTYQPQHTTTSILRRYDRVLYIVQDPVDFITTSFERTHQTRSSQDLFDSADLQSYLEVPSLYLF